MAHRPNAHLRVPRLKPERANVRLAGQNAHDRSGVSDKRNRSQIRKEIHIINSVGFADGAGVGGREGRMYVFILICQKYAAVTNTM